MDFKKFMNNKAVSPVIGVILMVAITVILAAAIGSAVFGQGTAQSAPQANIDIQVASNSGGLASIKLEHLGGDPINFATETKITASVNGGDGTEIKADGLTSLGIGDVKNLDLKVAPAGTEALKNGADDIAAGDTVNIKIIDVKTSQLICDTNIRF